MDLDEGHSLARPAATLILPSVSRRGIGLALAYFAIGALTLSPLLWATIPPLVDYPNHLARMSILLHGNDGSLVTTNYAVHWHLLPNLAMDLVVPLFAQILPLELAGKLFIALTMSLHLFGTATLHRVLHGRIALWPLGAAVFVYNAVLWYGFLNYLFGLGVVLFAFAAWVATESWPPFRRIFLFAILASGIFILHLFAFGVYGLLVASYEVGKLATLSGRLRDRIQPVVIALGQFLPAGLLWLAVAGGPSLTAYGGFNSRIFSFIAPALFANTPTALDAAVFIAEVAILPMAIISGALRIAPAMRWPLLAMFGAALVMPDFVSGSWGAHIRLPIAMVFVFFASTLPNPLRQREIVPVAAILISLLGLRVWGVTDNWRTMDAQVTELRAALQTLPGGIRLLTVKSEMPAAYQHPPGFLRFIEHTSEENYWHLPALAVIDHGVFLTPLFTGWYPIEGSVRNTALPRILHGTLTPAELVDRADTPPPAPDSAPRDILGEPPCCYEWPKQFDFVLWTDYGQPPQSLPKHLEPWASGSFFHLYRVIRP